MSNIPVFSYKDYLDKTVRLKDNGHVGADAQAERPVSAGARGLRKTKAFIDEPVHMMGESEEGRPGPANPNPNSIEEKVLDVPTPTVPELANKYGVSIKTIIEKLRDGIKIESEHTTDFNTAMEIALDHLNEKLDYYEVLATVEDAVDIDKTFHQDLMKYLNMKMVQIEKQIQDKPAKTPEEQDDKDFAVKLFKFVQQKLSQQDAKNESRSVNESELVVSKNDFLKIISSLITVPQTGVGKKEFDPRLLSKIYQALTGEPVDYDIAKGTYTVHKKPKTK
jgi:hypothetical protein